MPLVLSLKAIHASPDFFSFFGMIKAFFNPKWKKNYTYLSALGTNISFSLCTIEKQRIGEAVSDNPRLKMECKTPAKLQREAARKETPVIFIRIV